MFKIVNKNEILQHKFKSAKMNMDNLNNKKVLTFYT